MHRNFFKIALRYLWRNKTYSILNYLCLTFGLTCAIIAVLHIMNAFSYDKFHKNYDRLYSVEAYVTFFNGDRFPKEYLSASLGDVLKVQVPEIEQVTRVANRDYTFIVGNKSFTEKGIYADENFFDSFSFPLIRSDKQKVLGEMNSIMISERMAMKFFETIDCVGKTLVLKDGTKQEAYKIAGVLKKIPTQSLLQFDFVIPFSKFLAQNSWASETGATANQTWVLFKNNVNKALVGNKIKNLIKNQESTLNQELFLFPLSEKILYSYASGKRVWREMQKVVIVGSIGFAILLIACFNFINLAIALNIRRYREAGIKKVVGANRLAIIIQFLGETFMLTFISLLSALVLVKLSVSGFNTMFGGDIHLRLSELNIILIFTAITLFTGLLSGLFPALYLASSNPVNVLKGNVVTSHSYSIFRQGLIVFQFTTPIILIICMMIIKTQDRYIRNFDVGVDKDKLIILDNPENIQKHAESVKTEILSIPGVDAVSFTNCIPTRGGIRLSSDASWEGKDASEKLDFWCINSDFDYNKTVNIKMTGGRFFDNSFSSDSANYVINDVAAKLMKNKNPIGTALTLEGKKGTIIGVFTDFHAIDLAGPYVPTIIRIKPDDRPTLLVKFSSGSYPKITDKIRQVYKHYGQDSQFQARTFRDLIPYSELNTPSNLVSMAFFISIMLACFGLFGLASFTAESRTKEIGIRKVNGATTTSIMSMLLTRYTKWLTIAFFIALPLAFLLGKIFLGRFYFHTSMPYWTFLIGPAIAFTISLLTVSSQTWGVASRNPVKSLKYE
jgi:putative ABC transport system permease protein